MLLHCLVRVSDIFLNVGEALVDILVNRLFDFECSTVKGHSTLYGTGYKELCLCVEQQSCMRCL